MTIRGHYLTRLEAAHEHVSAHHQVLDVVKIREEYLETLQELRLTVRQLLGSQLKIGIWD